MVYHAVHTTRYHYAAPAAVCHTETRLHPRETPDQRVLHFELSIHPEPEAVDSRLDYFGNTVSHFAIREPHAELEVTARSVVEKIRAPEVDLQATPSWEEVRRMVEDCDDPDLLEAIQYTFPSPFVEPGRSLADYARRCFIPGAPVLAAARALCALIHKEFTYKPNSTRIDTPLEEVFANRRGVCQDFAQIMIGSLRSLGLPARYVSGYLRSAANYVGAEASHAWVSLFVPGSGWHDFDPTNNVIPSGGHVTVAWGRDYGDVTPVKGVTLGSGEHTVTVAVRVEPIPEFSPHAPFGSAGSPADRR